MTKLEKKMIGNVGWKATATEAVEALLEKPVNEVTMKDTRLAIKEYKEQFAVALKMSERSESSVEPYEIRCDFDRYHKELAKKMHEIEKNGNTETMEGRVAINDAKKFLWDGCGCDRCKIAW